MVCRLCLNNLNNDDFIPLFDVTEDNGESKMVKMIAKYLYLEITQNDELSTEICKECSHHLEDFHTFSVNVERQQSTLRNGYFEVICDELDSVVIDKDTTQFDTQNALADQKVELTLPEPIEFKIKREVENCVEELQSEFFEVAYDVKLESEEINNDETLLDIKDILVDKNAVPNLKREVGESSVEEGSFDEIVSAEEENCVEELQSELFEIAYDVKLDSEEINKDETLLDIQDDLVDQNAVPILKCEVEESSVVEGSIDELESAEDDIPLKYLRKHKKINEIPKTTEKDKNNLNSKNSKILMNINKNKLHKKIKCKTAKTKLKAMKNETTQKIVKKQIPKISPEESEEMHQFITNYMQMKCYVCEAALEKFTDVRPHFKQHHVDARPCIMCCESRFLTQKHLYEHVHWHLNPAYFKCDSCEKVFKNRHCLNLHIVDQHEKNEESCLRCPHCVKTFSRPTVFNQHVKTHTNIYQHICDFCGKKFKWKISFEKHVLEHQGVVDPPIQCKICGEFYKNKRLLDYHMDHHNTTDVKCKYCGHESPTAGALRGHISYTHRLQMNHQCTYCDKVFKRRKNLQEHVATHTGQNLYNCQYCDKEFRFNANMYAHVKRQHPQEWSGAQLKLTKSQRRR